MIKYVVYEILNEKVILNNNTENNVYTNKEIHF